MSSKALHHQWFDAARLGISVHWGPYSAMGREPSWGLVSDDATFLATEPVGVDEYYQAAAAFDPQPGVATACAELAAEVGADYAILTTKHHDGYCMFPFDEGRTLGVHGSTTGHDVVAEFVAACRRLGLRVGLYFSLSDWGAPDYPRFTDDMRPYQYTDYPRPDAEAWDRFLAVQRAQLKQMPTARAMEYLRCCAVPGPREVAAGQVWSGPSCRDRAQALKTT